MAYEIFPHQELNLCLLHWQGRFFTTLSHQGGLQYFLKGYEISLIVGTLHFSEKSSRFYETVVFPWDYVEQMSSVCLNGKKLRAAVLL